MDNSQYGNVFITADYLDAEASYRNGDLVYEYRKVRYSTEWTTVEHTIGYEWHRD
ncbi:hypothetical protein FACS18942_00420 [Planctomycetales bacterium]|nr:hypothetical protein FACS18942_00420 [Planctomycetales bacterium]GHT36052.1 hypothetical protein FACS189427_06900 [Planctomycetales bacterium]